MHPERAARLLSILGVYLLAAALIMRLVSLVMTTWQVRMGLDNISIQPAVPTFGQYQISPDGKQVFLARQVDAEGNDGWFTMPLVGGALSPSPQPSPNSLEPFQVSNDLVYYPSGETLTKLDALPDKARIASYSRSPDRTALAFAATWLSKSDGLFIISADGKLIWMGDHDQITDIAWSPDSKNLAYIAQVDGFKQLFIIRRDGQVEHQLTSDHTVKSSLQWSPDGQEIAYIAVSSPDDSPRNSGNYHYTYPPQQVASKWSIRLVGMNGENPRRFVEDDQTKMNLAWGIEGSNPVLLYSILGLTQIKTSFLYSLNPHTGLVRRVYPPQEITAFTCPPTIQPDQRGVAKIVIANSGSSEMSVNVVMRSSPNTFAAITPWDTNVVQSERVQVQPASTRTIDWPIQAQTGLFTHLSIGINPYGLFAMDERRCVIKNTYNGLPNLPFLQLMLPLSGAGLVLCFPWLRMQKKARLWALYLAVPVLTLVILYLEIRLVGM